MSDQLTLSAETRDRAGKGASRAVRREGRVPCVIYGNKEAALKSLDDAMAIDPASPLNARIEAMKKQMADAPMPEAKPEAKPEATPKED